MGPALTPSGCHSVEGVADFAPLIRRSERADRVKNGAGKALSGSSQAGPKVRSDHIEEEIESGISSSGNERGT
jgi:hypothetical protein